MLLQFRRLHEIGRVVEIIMQRQRVVVHFHHDIPDVGFGIATQSGETILGTGLDKYSSAAGGYHKSVGSSGEG